MKNATDTMPPAMPSADEVTRMDEDNRAHLQAERARLFEPAGVNVMEWESARRERRELEDRLDRALRQLATTADELQAARQELETLKAARP